MKCYELYSSEARQILETTKANAKGNRRGIAKGRPKNRWREEVINELIK